MEMDRKDLKLQAYRDKVSELEDRLADMRVDFTIISSRNTELQEEVQKLNDRIRELENVPKEDPEAVSGE